MSENNILDLPLADFQAYLGEMRSSGRNTDDLVRQYRSHNSPFSAINKAAELYRSYLSVQGRRPVGGFLSKESGTTGMDAVKSVDFNILGGLLGAGEAMGKTFDAPYSAARNLIPLDDMPAEALGTAGAAMALGGLAARPAGSVGMGGRADDLRRQANIQRFGYDPNEVADAPALSPSGGFNDYLSAVNPDGRKIPADARPNLAMGDMYGMLPRGAREVSERDGVKFYQTDDGATYATAFNPDVGDMDVVGYSMPGGDSTELAVVSEMQGRGIGGELQYLARSHNPYAQTGGLTDAGESSLRKTYDRLRDDGIVSANASQSGGLLGAGLSEAQRQARDILDMRAAGRAGDVTDEMMALADDQYMFANTPLPMDEAARLARAGDAGFGDDLYHGTNKDFDAFNSMPWGGETPSIANEYAASTAWDGATGQNVLPIRMAANSLLDADRMPKTVTIGDFVTEATEQSPAIGRGDFNNDMASARIANLRRGAREEESGPNYNRHDFWNNDQSMFGTHGKLSKDALIDQLGFDGVKMIEMGEPTTGVFDASKARSRFARFDPEFAHLSNLSAANVSPTAGLLAMQPENDKKELPFMELLKGFLR